MNLNSYRVTAHDENGEMLFLVQDPHAAQHLEFPRARAMFEAVEKIRPVFTYDFDDGEFTPATLYHYQVLVPGVVGTRFETHYPQA